MNKDNIDKLIALIENGSWEEALKASDQLGKRSNAYAFSCLIQLLKNRRSDTRNAAALTLREIGNNDAVEPLLQAINDPDNQADRSTLVYALETLDCSKHFIEIFKLALIPKGDIRISALNILHEQGFWVSDDEIKDARLILNSYSKKYQDDNVNNILYELLESLE